MKNNLIEWVRKHELDELNFIAISVAIIVGPFIALLGKASNNVYIHLTGFMTLGTCFVVFLGETFTTGIPTFKKVQLWDWVGVKLTYSRKERIVLILSMILYWVLSIIIYVWL